MNEDVQTGVLPMPLPDPEPRSCVCCRAPTAKAFCSRSCGFRHLFDESCEHYDAPNHVPADAPFDDSAIYGVDPWTISPWSP